jgi:dTDP-4-amino-4,6-dideoxygalactose transaminase
VAVAAGPPSVPLFDLRLSEEDIAVVEEVLRSGSLRAGERTAAFEAAFAAALGASHAIAVSSGTAALHLAYLAVGVGPGDEVVLPTYTFAATAGAAVYCGARPVFADVAGLHDLTLDPDDVARVMTPRTRAVATVHFAGYASAVEALASLCAERGVALVEDASHAPLAHCGGRALGRWGDVAAFSLFSNKVLGVGEGGVVVTDDAELASRIRACRESPELRYELDEPRSALALSRLGTLPEDIAARQELVCAYRRRLARVDGVFVPFAEDSVAGSSCYVMPVLVRDEATRVAVRAGLRERHGVQTSVLYEPVHRLTAYAGYAPPVGLRSSEAASVREVTLPLYPHLGEDGVERVCAALEEELSR